MQNRFHLRRSGQSAPRRTIGRAAPPPSTAALRTTPAAAATAAAQNRLPQPATTVYVHL